MLSSARPIRPLPNDMTSLVYHELATPLATALWYIGIADAQCAVDPHAPVREALAVARTQVESLRELVDRVLELEKYGRPKLRPSQADLGNVVNAVVRGMTAPGANEPAVSVDVRGALSGLWDVAAVDQIVRNLVSNAVKFGEGKPINIRVLASEGGAWILVRDEGIGVPAKDRKRIFDRHVCAPRARGGGLGLGLWLVRELAQAHGGRVSVRSRPGQGSTFRVFLQRQQPVPERAHEEPPRRWRSRPPRKVAAEVSVARAATR
jgi:signal transduction histidine kinase